MIYLLFAAGLVGLFFGGNWLVQGAVGIAQAFRVPPLVIGVTIVGFGTSTPELLVSLDAALRGLGGIAVGNVVGSNISNILLILGLSALVGSLTSPFHKLRVDLAWMVGAAVVCVPVFWDGHIARWEGGLLAAALGLYIGLALRQAGSAPVGLVPPPSRWQSALYILIGLVALMVGARLLVDSATEIARTFGISEAVIGLTIVAVGTSLPELATSMVAAVRGERDIALGNIIGSNVYNVFGILGISALVAPLPVEPRFLAVDVPAMIAVSLLLVLALRIRDDVNRWEGGLFVALYAGYIATMAA